MISGLWILSVLVFTVCPTTQSMEYRGPRMRIMTRQMDANTLNLPSNATSIRENITDSFSCENRTYGYYADVENDCQIFHVCLPVVYSNGKSQTFKWSFICPEETVFNQEIFVCVREEDSINCEDSEMYYELNDNFGDKEFEDVTDGSDEDEKQSEDNSEQESQEEAPKEERRRKPANDEQKSKNNDRRRTKI